MRASARRLGAVLPAALLAVALPYPGGTAHGAPLPPLDADVDIRLAPEATAISGSWIVVLEDGAESPHSLATSLLEPLGGGLTGVYDTALDGFAAQMTRGEAERLAADPRVDYIEQDAEITVADEQGSLFGPEGGGGVTDVLDSALGGSGEKPGEQAPDEKAPEEKAPEPPAAPPAGESGEAGKPDAAQPENREQKEARKQNTQDGPASWGLDRIDQRRLPLDESYSPEGGGSGATAYVIDTGIRASHEDFGGRARSGYDFVDDDANAADCHGHGTHVAGTVGGTDYGVAKGADVVGVRVLDCRGSGTTSQVVAGIDWVTEHAARPAVANLSLGGGPDGVLDDAVRRSIDSGVTYSIAAGNGNLLGWPQDACGTSPARVPEAITVGATDRDDARASFSNTGSCVDLFAPGVDIISASIGSDSATDTLSGTSMAAPHVTGVAALYLAGHPSAGPAQVRDAVVNAATDGAVGDPRAGSPDRLLHSPY
jgi:subtilisin family serine protease